MLRLLEAQASLHGVPVEELLNKEVQKANEIDPRCSRSNIERCAQWHQDAQAAFFGRGPRPLQHESPRILFGPNSKIVDHLISAQGLKGLVRALLVAGRGEELRRAIGHGPEKGGVVWDTASTPVELVAGIVRWSGQKGGEKCRLRATDAVKTWATSTLATKGVDTAPRLGGVSAVGSQLCLALGAAPTMLALGRLSPDLLNFLPPDLAVIGDDPLHTTLETLPRADNSAPNLSIQHKGAPLDLGLGDLPLAEREPGRGDFSEIDILVVGSGEPPFEGLSLPRAREIGVSQDAMILTGAHRLKGDAEISQFFDRVGAIRDGGAAIALLYTDARYPEQVPAIFSEIRKRGCVDYLSMNVTEAFNLLTAMLQASERSPLFEGSDVRERIQRATERAAQPAGEWGSGRESPRWCAESALLLQELTGIPLTRVRSRAVDVLIADAAVPIDDPYRVRNHLIVSRNLATLKSADMDGLLDSPKDLMPLRNIPQGKYVAALQRVQDVWRDSGEEGTLSTLVPESGFAQSDRGRTIFAVPPIQMYDQTGGTQSAGDTIDVSFVASEALRLLRAVRRR